MKFSSIFTPGRIGKLEVKNRIVLPAMGTNYPSLWGEVNDTLINYYARRAAGGAGLLIIEATVAATAVDRRRVNPKLLRADDTAYTPGLACVTEVIHERGAKAGIQLKPGGGAQAHHGQYLPGIQRVQPVDTISPSGVPAVGLTVKPRPMTIDEIHTMAVLVGDSAFNCKDADIDMIELDAHGGYILSQFLSPYFNKRTDEYGGSFENRCRFLFEVLASMRKAVGPDYPLTVKYSIEDSLPGGWDIEQSRLLARKLEEFGINGIGISSGVQGSKMPAVLPYFYPKGAFIHFAEEIKKVVKIPVFVGGRLDDPELAEKVLREGKTDFLFEGRALIADPDWPRKLACGKEKEIRPCLACNECRQLTVMTREVRCSVNATAGREGKLGSLTPAFAKKKVLVVGGGPGGMEAARIAALRGHNVTLCERFGELGGLTLLAGVHNERIEDFANWEKAQIKSLPIEVKLNTEVTPSLVKEMKPDAVILAIGGNFVTPQVTGIDRNNVFSAKDLYNAMHGIPIKKGGLLGVISPLAKGVLSPAMVRRMLESNFPIKKKVAVIGGQFPGCSLALFLAHKGKEVTIIEEAPDYGIDLEAHTKVGLNNEVEAGHVRILTSTKVDEIVDDGVFVIDDKGSRTKIQADNVISALDLAPSDGKLAEELFGKVDELHIIGDAKSFRRIRLAVSEGYVTAFNL